MWSEILGLSAGIVTLPLSYVDPISAWSEILGLSAGIVTREVRQERDLDSSEILGLSAGIALPPAPPPWRP